MSTPDPQAAPTLDIERIIRRAKLRSSREVDTALSIMLFQALHKRDPATGLQMRMLRDEGRSLFEQMYAIDYQGTLWTVRGPGDWTRQKELFLARTVQVWKNPVLGSLPPDQEALIEQSMLTTALPLSAKTYARIEEAVSFEEAQALARVSAAAHARRSGPRL